jgi:hypothetical protein
VKVPKFRTITGAQLCDRAALAVGHPDIRSIERQTEWTTAYRESAQSGTAAGLRFGDCPVAIVSDPNIGAVKR